MIKNVRSAPKIVDNVKEIHRNNVLPRTMDFFTTELPKKLKNVKMKDVPIVRIKMNAQIVCLVFILQKDL